MALAMNTSGHLVFSKKEMRELILEGEIKEVSKRLGCPVVLQSNGIFVMDCQTRTTHIVERLFKAIYWDNSLNIKVIDSRYIGLEIKRYTQLTIEHWPVITALVLSILAVGSSYSRASTDLKIIPIACILISLSAGALTGSAIRSVYADWKDKDDVDLTKVALGLIVASTASVLFKIWCDQKIQS